MRRRPLLTVGLAILTAGCGGSGGDKAGGVRGGERIVLPLASPDALYAHDEFAAAVERLSGGSVRIQVRGRDQREPKSEGELKVVTDVARGAVALGIVGARVWEAIGLTSFGPFVAPFMIDSLELQRKVLESPSARRVLGSLESIDLVGVAILPGAQLRPFGVTRRLAAPRDYEGARFGLRPGGIAGATLRALGADVQAYVPGSLSDLDGAELDVRSIADNLYDGGARVLTSNVVFWPRIQTVFMNRAAFQALTTAQRELLLEAGRDASRAVLAQIERDEARALDALCERGALSFHLASEDDLARLRQAAGSIYDELSRDPETTTLMAEIGALRRETSRPPPALRCGNGSVRGSTSSTALDGRWRYGPITSDELLDAGLGPQDARTLSGTAVFEFADGNLRVTAGTTGDVVASGTYEVRGDILRLVFAGGPVLQTGTAYELRWSVYRELLEFSPAPGGDPLLALIAKPLTRVSAP